MHTTAAHILLHSMFCNPLASHITKHKKEAPYTLTSYTHSNNSHTTVAAAAAGHRHPISEVLCPPILVVPHLFLDAHQRDLR